MFRFMYITLPWHLHNTCPNLLFHVQTCPLHVHNMSKPVHRHVQSMSTHMSKGAQIITYSLVERQSKHLPNASATDVSQNKNKDINRSQYSASYAWDRHFLDRSTRAVAKQPYKEPWQHDLVYQLCSNPVQWCLCFTSVSNASMRCNGFVWSRHDEENDITSRSQSCHRGRNQFVTFHNERNTSNLNY